MRIVEKKVFFKTDDRLFDIEKSGKKPYTVRILEHSEFYALVDSGVERVRIEHARLSGEFFERDFVSAVMLGKMFGRIFAGIAWDPKE